MKKFKILPLLVSAAFLASCGNGSSNDPTFNPKDFANKGNETSFIEATKGAITAYEAAKFEDWKPTNIQLRVAEKYSGQVEITSSKTSMKTTQAAVEKNSFVDAFDRSTKTHSSEYGVYTEVKLSGLDKSIPGTGIDFTVSNSATEGFSAAKESTKFYVENDISYAVCETGKFYTKDEETGFDFDEDLTDWYLGYVADYLDDIYDVCKKIPDTATEDQAKKAWEDLFNHVPQNPSFKIYQSGNVITAYVKGEEKGDIYEETDQWGINQAEPFFIRTITTSMLESKADPNYAEDTITTKQSTIDHFAFWVENGASVSRPNLSEYKDITPKK